MKKFKFLLRLLNCFIMRNTRGHFECVAMAQIVSWEKSFNGWMRWWWKRHSELHFYFTAFSVLLHEQWKKIFFPAAERRHSSYDWMTVSWKSLCAIKNKKNCGNFSYITHMTSSAISKRQYFSLSPTTFILTFLFSSKYRFLFMLTKAYNGRIYVSFSY